MLETVLTRHVRLTRTYSVDITYQSPGGLKVEWSPDIPTEMLGKKEGRLYRQARDELLAEVAQRTGQRILLVEA